MNREQNEAATTSAADSTADVMAFRPSESNTLGFELELQIIDQHTGDLAPGSVRILKIVSLACCRYDTTDGGLTWQATGDCLPEDGCRIRTAGECSREGISWR